MVDTYIRTSLSRQAKTFVVIVCVYVYRNTLDIRLALSGGYDDEEAAARAYDLVALKYWGPGTLISFQVKLP